MKLNKKDLIWSIILIAVPALAVLQGLIPGGMLMGTEEDPAARLPWCLLMLDGWINAGITASLLLLVMGYLTVLAVCYLRSQSTGTLKAMLIFAILSAVVGLLVLLTEVLLHPVPFFLIPLLMAAEAVLVYIRIKQEEARYGF